MNISHPIRCLVQVSRTSIPKPTSFLRQTRPFHLSCRSQNRKPPVSSVKELDLIPRDEPIDDAVTSWRAYTEAEKKAMKHHYTPSQLAAIEASEASIDLEDLAAQGIVRQDPWSLQYLDDLREIDPLIDKKPKAVITDSGKSPNLDIENGLDYIEGGKAEEAIGRGMKEIESRIFDSRSFEELFQQIRESRLPQSMKNKILGMKVFVGTEKEQALRLRLISLTKILGKEDPVVEAGRKLSQARDEMSMERYNDEIIKRLGPRDYDSVSDIVGGDRFDLVRPDYSELAPPIPKFEDPRIRWPTGDEDDPTTAGLLRLSLQTGYSQEELKKFKVKRLVQHRVVNQTRMGKIQSIYCLSIAGNGNGLLGIGEGKSAEPEDSRRQAMLNALRNMKPIHRYEARTIYGEVHGKVGATEVQLMTRPPGFGIRCMHLIFEICRVCGIHDLAARVTRGRNPMNTVKATYEALTKQRLPEDIARARGRKLVDVRKVYYAGQV